MTWHHGFFLSPFCQDLLTTHEGRNEWVGPVADDAVPYHRLNPHKRTNTNFHSVKTTLGISNSSPVRQAKPYNAPDFTETEMVAFASPPFRQTAFPSSSVNGELKIRLPFKIDTIQGYFTRVRNRLGKNRSYTT